MNAQKSESIINVKESIYSQAIISQFPIVGIGASAGGLEALEQFFGNMPNDNGMAFVVIQHLDSTHVGSMPKLLQRFTTMKVYQASNRRKVKPNCVYVMPPNKSMTLKNGELYLFESIEKNGVHLPIDIFFRSLADDLKEKGIGIILSGMGSDGSLGLKAIKENKGLAIVQDPATAQFDSMPRSATDSVIVDIVATAENLPAKLIAFLKYFPAVQTVSEAETKNISTFNKIIILLREQTGQDFSLYKKSTLFHRIEKRKGIHQINQLQDYYRFLKENPDEVGILFKEMLIGVTSFFRDAAVWEMLKENVFPALMNEMPDGYVLRAWVPACSTGEEAYSLAIIFKEALESLPLHKNLTLQIFATDLDSEAIAKGRKGRFSKNIATNVSAKRLKQYFTQDTEGYQVNNDLREMVMFAPQNVIKDPPFTKLDLLLCRNLLIYMEPELQRNLRGLFYYSLKPGGILLLGVSETLSKPNEMFNELDANLKIFKRSANVIKTESFHYSNAFYENRALLPENRMPQKGDENIQTLADQIMLQRYAPASVLVNDKGDILYITGRTGKYLEPIAGKLNWNIYAMAREGLRQALPGSFRKAMQNFDAVSISNIKVETNVSVQYVDITVQRIEKPELMKGLIMVIFTDVAPLVEYDLLNPKTGKQSSTGRLKEMEIQLQQTIAELQNFREEMQTSQETLQLVNEVLINSKEELQNTNEELQTVNSELQSKVRDQIRTNDDMKNVLDSSGIAVLFLDKELNIRRFSDQIIKIFKMRDADIGRPLTDLATDLQYSEMNKHALQVIKTLMPFETTASTNDGRWFHIRIIPSRTPNEPEVGLVMTFTDITVAKKLEIELKEANKALRKNKECL